MFRTYKFRLWTNTNQERELGIMLETHRLILRKLKDRSSPPKPGRLRGQETHKQLPNRLRLLQHRALKWVLTEAGKVAFGKVFCSKNSMKIKTLESL